MTGKTAEVAAGGNTGHSIDDARQSPGPVPALSVVGAQPCCPAGDGPAESAAPDAGVIAAAGDFGCVSARGSLLRAGATAA